MIIAVVKIGKKTFLYECHLKPKRVFQFPYYMVVVYTPAFIYRSVLPKFARQFALRFKKRPRGSFFKFLELVNPSNRALPLWVPQKG